jgi:transposase-like protein
MATGVSASTAQGRDPRYKRTLRARAAAMYEQGKTIRDIAETLGVSPGRAYILALEGGADMRPRGTRPGPDRPATTRRGGQADIRARGSQRRASYHRG